MVLLLAPAQLTTGPGGNGNDRGQAEQHSQDNKGKDPLQSDKLALKLRNAKRGGEDAEPEAHRVVLVGDDEERSVREDGPHEDVGEDPRDKAVLMGNHDGAVPVNGDKGPC